jgi:hypothetical protein
MHSRKVLVLASEPMLAAFLGMMLELESYEPAFANVGERPEDALTRVRPVLVVLLHSELDAARSDLFFARAARSGARIVVFGGPDADADLRSISQARRVPYFSMPVERAASRDIRRSRSPDDRREKAWDAPDGTLHFADETGQVWKVYDRRGMERRAHPAATPDVDYRAFVNDAGEERRYRPRNRESLELSLDELARQLAEATSPQAGED